MTEPVYFADADDPQLERAIKTARQTFRFLWRELSWEYRRIIPALDVACVKIAFSDPPSAEGEESAVEEMWINDIQFDGKLIYGTLINSPNWLTSVAEGDSVKIKPNRMNDWMYSCEGVVYGAYTVNYMRSKMGRGERSQHDAAWGLDFGKPDVIQLVPPEYIGEKKPGFLSRLTGAGPGLQDPAQVAAKEHPMAVNMTESLEEFVTDDPSQLTETDDRGFTMLHHMCLAGAARGANVLLKNGADGTAVTKNGMTPKTLAKKLGWKNVLKVLNRHGVS